METEKILMGQKQLQRWHLIKMVEGRKITLREAGEKKRVSYRYAKRIRRAIRDRGIKGLVHGNRGRPSKRRINDSIREYAFISIGLAKSSTGLSINQLAIEVKWLYHQRERILSLMKN